MAYDIDSETPEQAKEEFVDNLLDISNNETGHCFACELPCNGWDEISPWGTIVSNTTNKTNNLRTKKRKGKIDLSKKLTNIDTRLGHGDVLSIKTGKDVFRRNYDTLTYDTPTWRFIVDAKTYEYIKRSDPVKSAMNNSRRLENRSADFRTHTGIHGKTYPDAAMFFDDQLSVALDERDMYFTYKSRLMEVGGRPTSFRLKGAKVQRVSPALDKNQTSSMPTNDYSPTHKSGKNVVDRQVKAIPRERHSTPLHLRKEANRGIIERFSQTEPKQNSSRELQPKSKLVLNHVKLLQEFGKSKLQDERRDMYLEKLRKKASHKNTGPSAIDYPDFGLQVLPSMFGNGNEVGYIKKGVYLNSFRSSFNLSNSSSLNLSSELHLPAISDNVIPEQETSPSLWNDKTDTLLPPIFGTKMELSITNSNQGLL